MSSSNSSVGQREILKGVVKIVTYFNEENGYFVARVDVQGKERTATGYSPSITVGEDLNATGTWTKSSWGPQFKCSTVKLSRPTSADGIEKFLANSVKGIGKAFAKRLVQELGENVFEVIENHPERLSEIKGLGKKKIQALIDGYAENKDTRELEVFLFQLGLSKTRAKRVMDKYGRSALKRLKANPYLLCSDIWGIGFKMADEAARRQGVAPDSTFRITAGLHYLLREAEGSGSCGIPLDTLKQSMSELLRVDYAKVEACLKVAIDNNEVAMAPSGGTPCVFGTRVFNAEADLAKLLLEHNERPLVHRIESIDFAILDKEIDMKITLEHAQREAVRVALSSQVCIITGGPGTGKTTITKVLLECLEESGLKAISLCAPTGKAAQRASEATGFEAQTIHRILEVQQNGSYKFNEKNKLDIDVLAIDESSMCDIYLFLALLRALPANARLIIIGDVDQLPSVGPGKALSDIISSGVFPTVKLTQVFRQAAKSQIIKSAHNVNNGLLPDLEYQPGSDFAFVDLTPRNPRDEEQKQRARAQAEQETLRLVRDMYKMGFDPIKDVQVLAPMRKGVLGVISLNERLQALLNPTPSAHIKRYETKWCVGDKVMQLKNNYDKLVFNGDVGYIRTIDETAQTVGVEFDAPPSVDFKASRHSKGQAAAEKRTRIVLYQFAELDELALAYAITIHKSQGSEFPVVVMPLDMSHFMMLRRNLVYTGFTRAKKYFVGVGSRLALQYAVEHAQNDERWTLLKDRLQDRLPPALKDKELADCVQ